jgi:hypothetical protein
MAPESSVSSDELDHFITTPSANLTTDVVRISDDFRYDFDISESPFNHSFSFNANTDGGVGSTESGFSAPPTANFLDDSSVSRSRQIDDNFGWSNDCHQPQGHHEHLDGGEVSKAMEGISYTLGIPFHAPSSSNIIPNPFGDDFLHNGEGDFSPQLQHYTFNQAWPATSTHSNNIFEIQDVTYGLEYSVSNDFSNLVSWNTDEPFAPVSQIPEYFLDQEPIVRRQVFTPLMEGQNVPQLMVTYPSNAPRHINAIESPGISVQEISSQYSNALDTCLELFEASSSSVGPDSLGPIADDHLYINCENTTPTVQDIVWPSNIVVTSCNENSSSSATQLMPTLHSGSAFTETSENRSGSTTVTDLVHSRRQKNLPILPAPSKSYPETSHASNGLAHLHQVYGPQEAQPRRSDRGKLTEQGRENAREVRKMSSCVVCALKKQKVIKFLVSSSNVLAD